MVWCQTSWAGAMFSVDTEKNKIIDQFGRERIFHGENVIMKTIPFVPITTHFDARHTETQSNQRLVFICRYSFVDEDAQLLASMGHNTIRLGLLWAGLEPVEGQYNMTYMEVTSALLTALQSFHLFTVQEIIKCVDTAEKFGIHTVLDMHQVGRGGIFAIFVCEADLYILI